MTDLILNIKGIEDAKEIEFYVERERAIKLTNKSLIRAFLEDRIEYYVRIDTNMVGRGNLMARVVFEDNEEKFTRKVVVSGYTGISIPCMGNGNTIACGSYQVSFEKVSDIPNNVAAIYGGVIEQAVVSFDDLTETEIVPLGVVNNTEMEYNIDPGETILIAVPYVYNKKVYKDDGFGGKVPFDTSFLGANALEKTINNITYNIYGEFFTVGGIIKIYIE